MWIALEPLFGWAVEGLRDGIDIGMHCDRFKEPTGKYVDMPYAQCAVLDFRAPGCRQPRGLHRNLFYILYGNIFKSARFMAPDGSTATLRLMP